MIYETLRDVYVGDLTPEETAELKQYAKELHRAHHAKDGEKVATMVKEACAGLTDYETFEKVATLFIHLSEHGQEKFAFVKGLTNAAVIGLTALPYVREGKERRATPKILNGSIQQVFNERPDFFTPDKYDLTMKYFHTLANFAPDVAKQPMFVQNILDRFHRSGPNLMDLNIIKELTSVQSSITDTRDKVKGALSPKDDALSVVRVLRGNRLSAARTPVRKP